MDPINNKDVIPSQPGKNEEGIQVGLIRATVEAIAELLKLSKEFTQQRLVELLEKIPPLSNQEKSKVLFALGTGGAAIAGGVLTGAAGGAVVWGAIGALTTGFINNDSRPLPYSVKELAALGLTGQIRYWETLINLGLVEQLATTAAKYEYEDAAGNKFNIDSNKLTQFTEACERSIGRKRSPSAITPPLTLIDRNADNILRTLPIEDAEAFVTLLKKRPTALSFWDNVISPFVETVAAGTGFHNMASSIQRKQTLLQRENSLMASASPVNIRQELVTLRNASVAQQAELREQRTVLEAQQAINASLVDNNSALQQKVASLETRIISEVANAIAKNAEIYQKEKAAMQARWTQDMQSILAQALGTARAEAAGKSPTEPVGKSPTEAVACQAGPAPELIEEGQDDRSQDDNRSAKSVSAGWILSEDVASIPPSPNTRLLKGPLEEVLPTPPASPVFSKAYTPSRANAKTPLATSLPEDSLAPQALLSPRFGRAQ